MAKSALHEINAAFGTRPPRLRLDAPHRSTRFPWRLEVGPADRRNTQQARTDVIRSTKTCSSNSARRTDMLPLTKIGRKVSGESTPPSNGTSRLNAIHPERYPPNARRADTRRSSSASGHIVYIARGRADTELPQNWDDAEDRCEGAYLRPLANELLCQGEGKRGTPTTLSRRPALRLHCRFGGRNTFASARGCSFNQLSLNARHKCRQVSVIPPKRALPATVGDDRRV